MIPEIGAQLGDYRILSLIAKGAYGIVFEAEHVITRRIDALKIMVDAGPSSADEEERFLREIQVQASLHHPNIATVHNAFRTPYGLALVMELVQGESLRVILDRGRVPLARGVGYALATLAGLSCAERVGVVHRDIKPENILITPEGGVKLTDFGLAQVRNSPRITGSGESVGTPCYMSPEQVSGTEPADARSDIYATGVVLYELVAGKPPFQGTNAFAVMLAHRNDKPVPPADLAPEIGPRLNRVILTALEKNPEKRFQSAAEFHAALEETMAAAPAAAVEQTSELPCPYLAGMADTVAGQEHRRNGGVSGRSPAPRRRWAAVAAAFATGICGVAAVPGYLALREHTASTAAAPRWSPPVPLPPIGPPEPQNSPVADEPAAAPEPPALQPGFGPPRARPRRPKVPMVHSAAQSPTAPAPVQPVAPDHAVPAAAPAEVREQPPAQPGSFEAAPAAADPPPTALKTEPPPVPDDTAKPAAARRRNPIIRVLGRLFGRRSAAAAPSAEMPAAPAAKRR